MKKFTLALLCVIFLLSAALGFVACTEEHKHTFTEEKAEPQYLAAEATCTAPAKYYYSCACGEKGTETFASGNALGHSYSTDWSHNQTEHWHTATCGHDVEKDRAAHTFDENKKCTECGYVKTKPLGLELQSSVFDIDLATKTAYLKVANAVTDYDFIDKFAVADGARFDVCTDKQCNNKIASKRTDLIVGNNVFYILVTNGNDVASYTVTLRRRPIYTVTFNANGGTAVETQQVEEDGFATAPTTTRKGYEFMAWDYDFSSPVLREEVVTASWQIIVYNITYDLNVPSDSASQDVVNSSNPTTYTVEDEITFSALSRVGYVFNGWNTAAIEKGTIGDKNIVASWTAIDYKIVYNFGDASSASKATNNASNPATYTIEDEIAMFGEPTRAGYTFTGWDKGIAKGTTETQTVTASWQIIVYNITYDLNVPSDSASQDVVNSSNPTTYTVEDEITFSALSRVGYVFNGWNTAAIEKGTIGDKNIVASWTAIDYKIVYNFGDASSASKATNNASNPATYTIEDEIAMFGEPTRAGYTFTGWDKGIAKGTTETQTVTASWQIIVYNVSYQLNGGEVVGGNPTNYTVEEEKVVLSLPFMTGYTGAWNNDGKIEKGTTGDITFLAIYTPHVKLSYDGSTVMGLRNTSIKDLVILSEYNGISVSRIGDRAFRNCSDLTSITIPNSVTDIGDSAFDGCSSLTSIEVAVGNIKYHSQGNCIIETASKTLILGCKNSVIPVDGSVTKIGYSAFWGCSELTSITIPNSVTSISYSAFSGCSGLTSIEVTAGNAKYHSQGNCIIETKNKTLILGCKNSVIPVDGSVTSIGYSAFRGCSGLTSITIPNGVTLIGDSAFSDCSGLTSITIPDSVTSICDRAFSGCSGLTNITIGNSVTSIGNSAFSGCSGLASITIPNGVTSIGDAAFLHCSGLTSIKIPDSVTSIGDYAFNGCSGLTSITITDSVTSIGNSAFWGCSGLTSITIPNSVTAIGDFAFRGCSGLTSIEVAVGNAKYHSQGNCIIETASKTLILGCKNSVIPVDGSVTSIGDSAFWGCSGLTSITIPDSVTSIGEMAFDICIRLTSVTIGSGVTSIGDRAFWGCIRLTSIEHNGTISQWNAISKGSDWNMATGEYTIHCTDGDIAK